VAQAQDRESGGSAAARSRKATCQPAPRRRQRQPEATHPCARPRQYNGQRRRRRNMQSRRRRRTAAAHSRGGSGVLALAVMPKSVKVESPPTLPSPASGGPHSDSSMSGRARGGACCRIRQGPRWCSFRQRQRPQSQLKIHVPQVFSESLRFFLLTEVANQYQTSLLPSSPPMCSTSSATYLCFSCFGLRLLLL